jgi:hypothetical protein
VIANAVLSIVSSIIGGGLVLAGQFFVKRAEDKRVWLIRLQEAVSRPPEGARSVPDARVEQRFRSAAPGDGLNHRGVWRAWDEPDDEFQLAYNSARAAVSEFMAAVGAHILRDGAHR